MKAFILAAGLGTRLRPWTLSHPKALVPVEGQAMLHRVISRLRSSGFNELCVNIHHFGEQIIEYLYEHPELGRIGISDERDELLDTGGALVAASDMLCEDSRPFLVHNVDILSTADLAGLMQRHEQSQADVTLLVSCRKSSRKLWVGADMRLLGWEGPGPLYRPHDFTPPADANSYAFSGIYVIGKRAVDDMIQKYGHQPFPIMDWLLSRPKGIDIRCELDLSLRLLDIGKPDTLSNAPAFLSGNN